jgi:hypothetical protein
MRALIFGLSWSVAATLVGLAASARASIVLDLSGGAAQTALSGNEGTAGWAFRVLASITVEGLGIWDEGADGLHAPHEVGIWNSGGSLLRSVAVGNSGTKVASSSGLGEWIFGKVSPLFLTPGEYVVGAFYQASDPDHVRVVADADTISQILFGNAQTGSSSGALTEPTVVASALNRGVFGPNLFIASELADPVPEPATLVAWSFGGAAALAAAVWRRRGMHAHSVETSATIRRS